MKEASCSPEGVPMGLEMRCCSGSLSNIQQQCYDLKLSGERGWDKCQSSCGEFYWGKGGRGGRDKGGTEWLHGKGETVTGRGWKEGKREKKRKKRDKVGRVPPFKGRGTTQRPHNRLRYCLHTEHTHRGKYSARSPRSRPGRPECQQKEENKGERLF